MSFLRYILLVGFVFIFSCTHGPSATLVNSTTLSLSYSVYLSSDCYSTINVTESDSIILIDKLGYWDRWNKENMNRVFKKAFKLNDSEVKNLKKLVLLSNLSQLKDKYGDFDGPKAAKNSPVQIFTIVLNSKPKYISLKDPQKNEPSVPFISFFEYLMQLQSKYKKM